MDKYKINSDELEYLADMLRAVAFFTGDIEHVSAQSLEELEEGLQIAETALRRVIAEINSEYTKKN